MLLRHASQGPRPSRGRAFVLPIAGVGVLLLLSLSASSSSLQVGAAGGRRQRPTPGPGGEGPAWRSLAEQEFPALPHSTIECNDAEWLKRVCWVRNLYLLGDAAIFIANNPTEPLQEARLWEYIDEGDATAPDGPKIPINQLLTVLGEQEAAELFAKRAMAGVQPGSGGGGSGDSSNSGDGSGSQGSGVESTGAGSGGQVEAGGVSGEEVEEEGEGGWERRRQRRRGLLQAGSGAGVGGAWRLPVLEVAIAMHTYLLKNWWHSMDDVSQAAFRFCKYLGKCRYDDLQATASGILFINTVKAENFPPAVREAFSCYGGIFRLQRDVDRSRLEYWAAEGQPLVLVQTAVFGVGDEIVHPYAAEGAGVRRANDSMLQLQMEFLRHCAGLPTESPPRAVPTLRIVNRGYGDGRTIMGVAEIVDRLQKKKPAELAVDVRVTYPGGLNFSQQAWLFDETDILVIVHGAATGNLQFLPRKAVVIDLSSLGSHRHHQKAIVRGFPKPAYDVEFLAVNCIDYTEPMPKKLQNLPAFTGLPAEEKAQLLLYGQVSNEQSAPIIRKVWRNWHRYMFFFNIRPDIEMITGEFLKAVEVWYQKNGGSPAAAAVAQPGEAAVAVVQ